MFWVNQTQCVARETASLLSSMVATAASSYGFCFLASGTGKRVAIEDEMDNTKCRQVLGENLFQLARDPH